MNNMDKKIMGAVILSSVLGSLSVIATHLLLRNDSSKNAQKIKLDSLEGRTKIQSEALSFNGDSIPEVVYFDNGNKKYGLIKVRGKDNEYISGPVVEQDGIPFIQADGGFYDMGGRYFSNKPEAEKK